MSPSFRTARSWFRTILPGPSTASPIRGAEHRRGERQAPPDVSRRERKFQEPELMTRSAAFMAAILLLGPVAVAEAADPAAGQAKSGICATCHGRNGIGTAPNY